MTKDDLVVIVMKETGLRKAQVSDVIESMLDNITLALIEDEEVSLRGFGKFYMKERDGRSARNLSTNEVMIIPPRLTPAFAAGETLKRKTTRARE